MLTKKKQNRAWLVRSVLFQNKIWKIKNIFFRLNTRTERNKRELGEKNKKKGFIFWKWTFRK